MKIKTSELTGPALDLAVAKCEYGNDVEYIYAHTATRNAYSSDWSQGGPIIEREGILLRPLRRGGHTLDGQWLAMFDGENTGTMVQWVKRTDWIRHYWSGPTPLIAAMRCYVASKLGDEPEVPDELR